MSLIADNLARVRRRIALACGRAGRDESGVTLVAVVKTVTPAEVRELYELGVRDFGENRIPDGMERMRALGAADARWHMIGHLQRNKAASALAGGFLTIHSVESPKLVEVLDRECGTLGVKADILLEANLSGEEAKYGVSEAGMAPLAEAALRKPNLNVRGLMAMAPLCDDPEEARPVFRGLRLLRDRLQDKFGAALPQLSMGMTGDFEVAVEEGATMVRIGTALFH